MKTINLLLIIFLSSSCLVSSQTYVSGGIYSDTTWLKSNSPYIVTDPLVVFPGVTLTIEPGVTVKVDDNDYIEVRSGGTLNAVGTITDSIIFTSNSQAPVMGIWYQIQLDGIGTFNYCRIEYAENGISRLQWTTIKNSVFMNNEYGILYAEGNVDSCIFRLNNFGISAAYGLVKHSNISDNSEYGIQDLIFSSVTNCTINSNNKGLGNMNGSMVGNCEISYNQYGIYTVSGTGGSLIDMCRFQFNECAVSFATYPSDEDILQNCEIKFNTIGIIAGVEPHLGVAHNCIVKKCNIESNGIGIEARNQNFDIFCNRICNNNAFGFKVTGIDNCSIDSNYWCTSDSASIAAMIYDGYDDPLTGLAAFLPIDSSCTMQYGILVPEQSATIFSLSPNPASSMITIELPEFSTNKKVEILNVEGQLVLSSLLNAQTTNVDIQLLPGGIYMIQVSDNLNVGRKKLLKY